MKILLIRHAQSTNNLIENTPGLNREQYEELRNKDPDVSELGKMQYIMVAEYLKKQNLKISRVYCSAMRRAMECAAILKNQIKCEVEILIDIHEEGGMYHINKAFKGISKSEVEQNYSGFYFNAKEITEDGWYFKDHRETKEEFDERAMRVAKFLQNLAFEFKESDETLIFITHGNFLNKLMHVLLEIEKNSDFFFEHQNASITCFETNKKGELFLNFFNYQEHLEDLPSKL